MPVGLAAAVFRNSAVFWKAVMWGGGSLWGGKCLVAFRRATSDGFSRAVPDAGVERMHLVTANSAGFYRQLGFRDAVPQQLLVLKR